jgi:uncharacterized protein (DUF608 family)
MAIIVNGLFCITYFEQKVKRINSRIIQLPAFKSWCPDSEFNVPWLLVSGSWLSVTGQLLLARRQKRAASGQSIETLTADT